MSVAMYPRVGLCALVSPPLVTGVTRGLRHISGADRQRDSLDVQDAVQTGDGEDPDHRGERVPQDELPAEELGAAVGGDEQAEAGRVDRVDCLQVDDDITVGGVDQLVQGLPDIADGADVQDAGQVYDVVVGRCEHVRALRSSGGPRVIGRVAAFVLVKTPWRHGRLPRPHDLFFRETIVSVSGGEYFAFPIVAIALAATMVLLCRWAFSKAKGGSLVRRVDHRPAERDAFGLLIDVHTARTYNEARVMVSKLKDFGIKATAARTNDGWTVYVWPRDEAAARGLLDAP